MRNECNIISRETNAQKKGYGQLLSFMNILTRGERTTAWTVHMSAETGLLPRDAHRLMKPPCNTTDEV